ncbi:hypothetical protein GCM10020229_69990 [Kitasatospora albolonga]|uniref:hypothetical protein n=1 Tax=Kitasatospora albolonga TaxID=68173 RepID=UPI0031EEEE29
MPRQHRRGGPLGPGAGGEQPDRPVRGGRGDRRQGGHLGRGDPGNTFDGRGVSGQNSADSWLDVKGFDYLIEGTPAPSPPPGTFANGYETHNPATTPAFPNGCGNTWRDNRSDLGGVGGYAIKITSVSACTAKPNRVYASNTVTNAVSGLTNVPVTP